MRLHQTFIFVFFASVLLLSIPGHSQQADRADFDVTIVAVTEFSDQRLLEPQLISGIKDATKNLKQFFEDKLHIRPVIFTTAGQTSQESLHRWLRHDLRYDSRPIHLIFVLTHGFPDKTPEANTNKTDLYIATSGSTKDDYYANSISGAEFIDTFRNMHKRATVFLFLDTCGSGAISGDALRNTLLHEPEFASRLMILAAAMPNESAYSARFTKALVNIWQTPTPQQHCGKLKIQSYVTGELKAVSGVSPDSQQTVKLIAPLMPDFCIESFNFTNRLLFLFNGAGVSIEVTLRAQDEEPSEPMPMDPGESVPIGNLRPTTYELVAKRTDGGQAVVESIDLTSTPGKSKVLFNSDPLVNIGATQRAVIYLESRDILPFLAAELSQTGRSAITARSQELVNDSAEVDRAMVQVHVRLNTLESNVQQAHTRVEAAVRERDAARQRASSCAACAFLERGRLEQAEAAVSLTRAEESNFEGQRLNTQQEEAKLTAAKNEVQVEQAKLASLETVLVSFEAGREHNRRVEAALTAELQKSFPDVLQTNRGVAVVLPKGPAWGDGDSLAKLADILNKFPTFQIEIEVSKYGKNSVREQLVASKEAAMLMGRLQRLGLRSSAMAARGLVKSGDKHPIATIILSQ
jgi:hypothetical protein